MQRESTEDRRGPLRNGNLVPPRQGFAASLRSSQ